MRPKIQLPPELLPPARGSFTRIEALSSGFPPSNAAPPRNGRFVDADLYLDARVQAGLPPDLHETEKGSHKNASRPDAWWHAIPAAVSWVMDLLIEGFAACAQTMHPGFFGPYGEDFGPYQEDIRSRHGQPDMPGCSDPAHHHDQGEASYPHEGPNGWSSRFWPDNPTFCAHLDIPVTADAVYPENRWQPEVSRASSSGQGVSVMSAVSRFWSRLRRGRTTGLAIQDLETLDDRTLRDIGISRSQIERPSIARDYNA